MEKRITEKHNQFIKEFKDAMSAKILELLHSEEGYGLSLIHI